MRITNHPILKFDQKQKLPFTFDGEPMVGYEGDTIASALHANNVKVLGYSSVKHRPRGFYCAIGNCTSCNMVVNDEPNVRTCITALEAGMIIKTQQGKGELI
ncbi:MAG: (2Fe-2S)-binding protein [Candidatus Izimaplasma sp.]|nr:(2Fe-2S)-binding protein [Candidatus Izimaplasma bacterium]